MTLFTKLNPFAAKKEPSGDVVGADSGSKFDGGEEAISELSLVYASSDFTKWNPDSLIGRKGTDVYKKMMQDEQIKAGVKFKRDAITSRGYYFKLDAEDSGLSPDEVARRIAVTNAMIDKMEGSFADALVKILSAVVTGYSLTEVIGGLFSYEGKLYEGIRKLKLKPAYSFKFKVDSYGNIDALVQIVNGKEVKLDYSKFLHFVVNPDVDEHYGESELRCCYRPWFSKDMAIKFRNIYLEKFAGGFRTITPPKDKPLKVGSPMYAVWQKILTSINISTGIVIPEEGYKLETVFPSGTGADTYDKTINSCDMQMARGLLIPPLIGVSPQGDTGSYSQSSTQLDAFFWTLINDANRLAECLNEQMFRPLGMVNFGDEFYPRFTWNPGSHSKAVEIIKLFSELVSKKVLKRTEEDEVFIRDALELPAVKEYASDDDGKDVPGNDPGNLDPNGVDPSLDPSQDPNAKPVVPAKPGDAPPDETIIGKDMRTIVNAAFKKAQSRVSFAMIGTGAEGVVEDNVNNITSVTDNVLSQLIAATKQGGDLSEDLLENYKNIKVDTKLKQKLHSAVTKVLREGERLGRKEAAKEIDKAMGTNFSARADYARIDNIALDYYKVAAFRITGNILDEMVKLIENEILNGARYDKSWEEVERNIYTKAAAKGLLSVDEAKQALADALGLETADHRLRTIVRTSTFEAINNARDAYFTDPQLGDFVRAYEYSAILDSRVTDICRHLDEENAGDHSIDWYASNPGYKPPNHFNCRSLLIAVTVNDLPEYHEGPAPSLSPQEGFN